MNDNTPQVTPSKPARDERGRLLPGHTANPSGLSKASAEVKEMANHVLMNKGWDTWYDRLNDPKTPAVVIHQMIEWLYAVCHGKPGIRKEEREFTLEDMKNLVPTFVYNRVEELEAKGYKVPKNTDSDEQPE